MKKANQKINYIYASVFGVIVFDKDFKVIEKVSITLDELKALMNKYILDKEKSLSNEYETSLILGYKEITDLNEKKVFAEKISCDKTLLQKAQLTINELTLNKKEYTKAKELTLELFENTASCISSDFNLISSCVKSVEDLDDSINKVSKRAQETLFEFIPKKLLSEKNSAVFISQLESVSYEEINSWCQKEPLGKLFDTKAYNLIISYSKSLSSLFDLKEEMLAFLKSKLLIICPNLYNLLGETITSKLISKAGSLERLAKMPSSTIQLLGAENAFFRFLKSGGRNPKHGYIYNHPFVLRAKRKNQGKAARILANKISICAKVDFFSKLLINHADEYSVGHVDKYFDEFTNDSISQEGVGNLKINRQKSFISKAQIPKESTDKTYSQDKLQKLPFIDLKISEEIKKELLKFAEKL